MDTPYEFAPLDGRTVYVKSVPVADLPEDVRAQAEGLDQMYAVHNEDGQQLALVSDRRMAFVLARQHDFVPVTVH